MKLIFTDPEMVEHHITPQGLVLAILAPITLLLNIPPLLWHIRNRNLAAGLVVLWVMMLNLIATLNVVIWPYLDKHRMYDGRILCDVEVKLLMAADIGAGGASLCIFRHLAIVLSPDAPLPGQMGADSRKDTWIEAGVCIGLPLVTMFFHYVVQSNRFYLFGISGCVPSISISWISFSLIVLPICLICIIGGYYAVLVLKRTLSYRSELNSILGRSGLTTERLIRLGVCASVVLVSLVITTLITAIISVDDIEAPMSSRWEVVHNPFTWNTVIIIPSAVVLARWSSVCGGFLLFFTFGLGTDAKNMWTAWLSGIQASRVVARASRRRKETIRLESIAQSDKQETWTTRNTELSFEDN